MVFGAMLKNVHFEGYRGFEDFHIHDLAPVNVLVGRNNAGKTSALEGIEVLARGCTLQALLTSLFHRAEFSPSSSRDVRTARVRYELDVCRLFHGFDATPGCRLAISGTNGETLGISASIVRDEERAGLGFLPFEDDPAAPAERYPEIFEEYRDLALRVTVNDANESIQVPLSPFGGVTRDFTVRGEPHARQNVVNIPAEGLDMGQIGRWWSDVVLTDAEDQITEALRLIEPEIDRIAFIPGESGLRESFKVRLATVLAPIPLGTLGEGMKRMLAIACAVQRAANGSFFVDEIDTGLHHSTLNRLWRLLIGTAVARRAQVFSTTHSLDCLRSLALLIDTMPEIATLVAVYRIDKSEREAIRYTGQEVQIALEAEMEIRG